MTNRREFVSSLVAAGILVPAGRLAVLGSGRVWPSPVALPTATQLRWQDLEVGMFVHFGPATWMGRESGSQPPLLEQNGATKPFSSSTGLVL